MAEEDGEGAVAFGGRVEGGVAGVTGGRLGSAFAADGHGGGLDRVEAEFTQPQDDLVGAQVGAGLQAVVDGDAAGAEAELGGFEGEGRGEGHGVGATGARHEHERRLRALVRGVVKGAGVAGRTALGRTALGRTTGSRTAVLGEDVVEDAADRQAYRRDRRMGTHVRFPS